MFKKLALSGLMLSLCSFPLLAQQAATPDAKSQTTTRAGRNHSMAQRQMADPETRAHKMTDRMTKQLGLDESTSKKVYDVTLARAQNADEFKTKIKSILTPDQFTKFESMHDKMRKGRRGSDGAENGQIDHK